MRKVREEHGRMMYTGKRRGKTGVEFTFMLLRPALAVLKKYGGKLPLLSNVKYNQYLKVVCSDGGCGQAYHDALGTAYGGDDAA